MSLETYRYYCSSSSGRLWEYKAGVSCSVRALSRERRRYYKQHTGAKKCSYCCNVLFQRLVEANQGSRSNQPDRGREKSTVVLRARVSPLSRSALWHLAPTSYPTKSRPVSCDRPTTLVATVCGLRYFPRLRPTIG